MPDEVKPRDVAAYLSTITLELSRLAKEAGLDHVSFCLGMAWDEAASLAKELKDESEPVEPHRQGGR